MNGPEEAWHDFLKWGRDYRSDPKIRKKLGPDFEKQLREHFDNAVSDLYQSALRQYCEGPPLNLDDAKIDELVGRHRSQRSRGADWSFAMFARLLAILGTDVDQVGFPKGRD